MNLVQVAIHEEINRCVQANERLQRMKYKIETTYGCGVMSMEVDRLIFDLSKNLSFICINRTLKKIGVWTNW